MLVLLTVAFLMVGFVDVGIGVDGMQHWCLFTLVLILFMLVSRDFFGSPFLFPSLACTRSIFVASIDIDVTYLVYSTGHLLIVTHKF